MKSSSARLTLATLATTLVFAAAAPSARAGSPAATPVQLPAPPPGKGQVVFYRKPMVALVPFNWIAREGKTEICEMVAGTYCVATVDPGKHTYEVHSEVTNRLTLEVDAGETYYVIGGISMGLVLNHPNISPTQKAQFDAISAKLKVKAAYTAAAAPGASAPDAAPTPPAEAAPAAPAAAAAPTAPTEAAPATSSPSAAPATTPSS
jgi:hypothetical protein